ncbi:hypothetical protein MMC32_005257 [Xylographa parallela]|nr:hypothetical protein [Xylographa parallela]
MHQDWDDVKAHIKEYYKIQNKSLEELEQLMIEKHGFHRSRRSYMNKIVAWGYGKKKRRRERSPPSIRASGLHAATGTISNSNFSVNPAVSSLWMHSQPLWPATGYLGSPLQDTLDHSYDNYQSLPTSVLSSRIGSVAHQSSQAQVTTEATVDIYGQTPLHHAAIKGDLERVQMLLSRDYSLHDIDHYGNQPLHYAAEKLCVGIVDLLLKNGANVNARGAGGKTPLHLALRSTEIWDRLMREHPTRTAHDDKGNTALHAALAAFYTAFNSAVSVRTIEKLVRSGYDVNKRNSAGETPFHMALGMCSSVAMDVPQILILFFENQADISLPDINNKMPFQVFLDGLKVDEHWSYDIGMICQQFLRCGADPNTASKGFPLLHTSIKNFYNSYRASIFPTRLCETADIHKLADNGDSPLHVIAKSCYLPVHSDLANILLRRGASPDQFDKSGNSPLMLLSKTGTFTESTTSMMASLIQAGVNPMQRDPDGDLPVYHVYRSKNPHGYSYWREAVRILVKSYSAVDIILGRSTIYPNDHIWWLEYQRLSQQETCVADGLRRLAGFAHYLPNDIGKEISEFLLIEAVHHMLKNVKEKILTHKSAFGQQTIEGQGLQDTVVGVLRECLRMKLDIDQSWYHLTLEFFD